jgi:hypothetical protein
MAQALAASSSAVTIESQLQIAKQMEQTAKKAVADLHLPYQDKQNPLVDQAQERMLGWIRNHKILSDEKSIKKIEMAAFARLIGNAHPQADLNSLGVVVDFAAWLFIYDDMIENQETEGKIKTIHKRTKAILNGAPLEETDTELTKGFFNIVERINKKSMSSIWTARLRKDMKAYRKATVWEFRNRNTKRIPAPTEYKENRTGLSGTKVMFNFIEFVQGTVLPQHVLESDYVKKAISLGVDMVNIENDIISAPKEYLSNDVHNLVFVLKASNDSTYEEAIQKAAESLSSVAKAFMELKQHIPQVYGADEEGVKKYINGIEDWASAYHFWTIVSPRYIIAS